MCFPNATVLRGLLRFPSVVGQGSPRELDKRRGEEAGERIPSKEKDAGDKEVTGRGRE